MQAFLRRFVEGVLAHQKTWLLGFVIITILAALPAPSIVFSSTLGRLFFGEDHEEYKAYKKRTEQFGVDESVIVGVKSNQPFAKENLDKLAKVHEDLNALDYVYRVTSIETMQRVGLVDDTIAVRNFSQEARESEHRANEILAEAKKDPLVASRLIAESENHFVVLIELKASGRSAEDAVEKIAEVESTFLNAGYLEQDIFIAGGPAIMAAIIEASYGNILRVLPFVFFALLIAVFLMFGRIWPTFVTTISAAIAIAWTMGFALTLDPKLDIMMTLVPALVAVISFSDVVHICSAYLIKLDDGEDKRTAVIEATVEVGNACFLTSLTTAVGFISMIFVPTPMFQRMGSVAALGVCVAYFVAMVLVPIVLIRLPKPKRWTGGEGRVQRWMDIVLEGCARLATQRAWHVILSFAVLLALTIYGASQVEIETVFADRLDESNRARQSEMFLREHFVNTTSFELYVETEEEGGVIKADFFNRFAALQKKIEALPSVDKVVSLYDLLATSYGAIVGGDPENSFLPARDDSLAQLMVLIEQQGPGAASDYVDFGRRTVRSTIFAKEQGIVQADRLRREVLELADAEIGESASYEALGVAPMLGAWVDNIVKGQRQGLAFSFLIIALIIAFAFRSLRVSFFSMIPNLLPLLAILGLVGFLWDKTDSDILIVLIIAIGIGVDDTIHFLSRLKLEAERTDDIGDAIRETFRFSGRGIAITTFVFMVGNAPMYSADYFTVKAMGYLLPYCFFIALVADLLLLPAMAKVGWIRFKCP